MSLRRELGRKAFHLLGLFYLAAYRLIGYPRVLWAMAAWLLLVAATETVRLGWPALNRLLMRLFRGLIRDSEQHAVSGLLHTTAGSFLTMLLFGRHPRVVAEGLLCLALGDAAAALFGKAFGRHRLPGSAKTLEGSLACLAACLLAGFASGLGPVAAAGAALTATCVELLPTTAWFNDNLWLPVAAAAAAAALTAWRA